MFMNIVKTRLRESLTFEIIENLMGEEYPQSFNIDQFKTLKSFKQRLDYCNQNLQKIGAGSGRTVYKIDNTKVLKLAKNARGVAQNQVEVSWSNDYYFEAVLAKVIDSHPDNLWVEMELARKVTPTMFKKYFGVSYLEFGMYLTKFYNQNHGKKNYFYVSPEAEEILKQSTLFSNIYEFADATDSPGDLGRLSSYGWVNREGEDRIVIIDFGLDSDVYETYYS